MIDYMKNTLIGLFVVVACGLIIGIILFLEPSVGDGGETLIVRFSNINGITVGTRVMFAGRPVGEVVSIEQIPHAREQPTDELGQVYFYQLTLHIDSSVHVYNTDEITVQTSGLLGEKSIAIIPRSPPRGVKPKLVTANTPIYAESIDPIESAFNELAQLSDKVEETLDKIIAWIDQNGHELGAAIRSFDDAMSEASMTLSDINTNHLVEEVQFGIQKFALAMQGIEYAIEQMNEDNVFSHLGTILENIKNTSFSLDYITNYFAGGKGTLGKLFMQDETYLRLTAILSKINTLMNDVNHYGVFFNLNKQWQRTRLKQVAFLNALSSPQSFQDYFTKQVDLINTSMSRLSMLVKKAEYSPESEAIFKNALFQKDFAELLREAETLYDNLRLYNQQFLKAQKTQLSDQDKSKGTCIQGSY